MGVVGEMEQLVSNELRTSMYTIYADLPDDRESMLLVHGYSGAYDRVSRGVGEYIRSLDVRAPKPLYGEWTDAAGDPGAVTRPADATIEHLKKRGYLTSMTRDQERARFANLARVHHAKSRVKLPDYILMPTYDCNLRCDYCFQDHMRRDAAYSHLLRFMTPKVVDRILKAMPVIEERHEVSAGPESPRNIVVFGGEPFLARGRKLVEYIMDGVRALGPVKFSGVSNATELDAYADLLGPDGIATLQITIDGPKARHDGRRIYADGSGSYDRIVANVDLALARGVHVDIRMNLDRSNIGEVPELVASFEARGWFARRGFTVWAAPIHAYASVDRKTTFNSNQLVHAIRALYDEHPVLRKVSLPDDILLTRMRAVLRGADPLRKLKSSYCGAHSQMYIFDAFADIYACWERTGDANVRIGWVDENGRPELLEDRVKHWRDRSVTTNETCGQCRYALHCGGGCAVLAESVHGTIYSNYCDAFGRRFRETLALAYAELGTAVPVDERVAALRAL